MVAFTDRPSLSTSTWQSPAMFSVTIPFFFHAVQTIGCHSIGGNPTQYPCRIYCNSIWCNQNDYLLLLWTRKTWIVGVVFYWNFFFPCSCLADDCFSHRTNHAEKVNFSLDICAGHGTVTSFDFASWSWGEEISSPLFLSSFHTKFLFFPLTNFCVL